MNQAHDRNHRQLNCSRRECSRLHQSKATASNSSLASPSSQPPPPLPLSDVDDDDDVSLRDENELLISCSTISQRDGDDDDADSTTTSYSSSTTATTTTRGSFSTWASSSSAAALSSLPDHSSTSSAASFSSSASASSSSSSSSPSSSTSSSCLLRAGARKKKLQVRPNRECKAVASSPCCSNNRDPEDDKCKFVGPRNEEAVNETRKEAPLNECQGGGTCRHHVSRRRLFKLNSSNNNEEEEEAEQEKSAKKIAAHHATNDQQLQPTRTSRLEIGSSSSSSAGVGGLVRKIKQHDRHEDSRRQYDKTGRQAENNKPGRRCRCKNKLLLLLSSVSASSSPSSASSLSMQEQQDDANQLENNNNNNNNNNNDDNKEHQSTTTPSEATSWRRPEVEASTSNLGSCGRRRRRARETGGTSRRRVGRCRRLAPSETATNCCLAPPDSAIVSPQSSVKPRRVQEGTTTAAAVRCSSESPVGKSTTTRKTNCDYYYSLTMMMKSPGDSKQQDAATTSLAPSQQQQKAPSSREKPAGRRQDNDHIRRRPKEQRQQRRQRRPSIELIKCPNCLSNFNVKEQKTVPNYNDNDDYYCSAAARLSLNNDDDVDQTRSSGRTTTAAGLGGGTSNRLINVKGSSQISASETVGKTRAQPSTTTTTSNRTRPAQAKPQANNLLNPMDFSYWPTTPRQETLNIDNMGTTTDHHSSSVAVAATSPRAHSFTEATLLSDTNCLAVAQLVAAASGGSRSRSLCSPSDEEMRRQKLLEENLEQINKSRGNKGGGDAAERGQVFLFRQANRLVVKKVENFSRFFNKLKRQTIERIHRVSISATNLNSGDDQQQQPQQSKTTIDRHSPKRRSNSQRIRCPSSRFRPTAKAAPPRRGGDDEVEIIPHQLNFWQQHNNSDRLSSSARSLNNNSNNGKSRMSTAQDEPTDEQQLPVYTAGGVYVGPGGEFDWNSRTSSISNDITRQSSAAHGKRGAIFWSPFGSQPRQEQGDGGGALAHCNQSSNDCASATQAGSTRRGQHDYQHQHSLGCPQTVNISIGSLAEDDKGAGGQTQRRKSDISYSITSNNQEAAAALNENDDAAKSDSQRLSLFSATTTTTNKKHSRQRSCSGFEPGFAATSQKQLITVCNSLGLANGSDNSLVKENRSSSFSGLFQFKSPLRGNSSNNNSKPSPATSIKQARATANRKPAPSSTVFQRLNSKSTMELTSNQIAEQTSLFVAQLNDRYSNSSHELSPPPQLKSPSSNNNGDATTVWFRRLSQHQLNEQQKNNNKHQQAIAAGNEQHQQQASKAAGEDRTNTNELGTVMSNENNSKKNSLTGGGGGEQIEFYGANLQTTCVHCQLIAELSNHPKSSYLSQLIVGRGGSGSIMSDDDDEHQSDELQSGAENLVVCHNELTQQTSIVQPSSDLQQVKPSLILTVCSNQGTMDEDDDHDDGVEEEKVVVKGHEDEEESTVAKREGTIIDLEGQQDSSPNNSTSSSHNQSHVATAKHHKKKSIPIKSDTSAARQRRHSKRCSSSSIESSSTAQVSSLVDNLEQQQISSSNDDDDNISSSKYSYSSSSSSSGSEHDEDSHSSASASSSSGESGSGADDLTTSDSATAASHHHRSRDTLSSLEDNSYLIADDDDGEEASRRREGRREARRRTKPTNRAANESSTTTTRSGRRRRRSKRKNKKTNQKSQVAKSNNVQMNQLEVPLATKARSASLDAPYLLKSCCTTNSSSGSRKNNNSGSSYHLTVDDYDDDDDNQDEDQLNSSRPIQQRQEETKNSDLLLLDGKQESKVSSGANNNNNNTDGTSMNNLCPPKSNRSRSVDISLPIRPGESYAVLSGTTTINGRQSDNDSCAAAAAVAAAGANRQQQQNQKQPNNDDGELSTVLGRSKKFIQGEIKVPCANGETRALKLFVNWEDDCTNGEHLWVYMGSSSEACYVGESECLKHGPRLCCSACKITAHTSCISILMDKIKFICKHTFKDLTINNPRQLKELQQQNVIYHHWVHKRTHCGRCKQCTKTIGNTKLPFSSKEIQAITCSWCKVSYHNKENCYTLSTLTEPCTLGAHRESIIPPSWILKLPATSSNNSNNVNNNNNQIIQLQESHELQQQQQQLVASRQNLIDLNVTQQFQTKPSSENYIREQDNETLVINKQQQRANCPTNNNNNKQHQKHSSNTTLTTDTSGYMSADCSNNTQNYLTSNNSVNSHSIASDNNRILCDHHQERCKTISSNSMQDVTFNEIPANNFSEVLLDPSALHAVDLSIINQTQGHNPKDVQQQIVLDNDLRTTTLRLNNSSEQQQSINLPIKTSQGDVVMTIADATHAQQQQIQTKQPRSNICSGFKIVPRPIPGVPSAGSKPVLVFVNPRSGGNQGVKMMQKFNWLLNPRQVFDLIQSGGPRAALELYRDVPNLRILTIGGDGTASWILSHLDDIGMSNRIPVAVLPLGTGNDLARALGWGGGYADEPLAKVLTQVRDGEIVQLDRWNLYIERNYEVTPSSPSEFSSAGSGANIEFNSPPSITSSPSYFSNTASTMSIVDQTNNCDISTTLSGANTTTNMSTCFDEPGNDRLPMDVINNYFSFGVDAHIALEFHTAREAHPERFNSRLRNKMFYGQAGGKDLLKRKWKDLSNFVTLYCDGQDMTSRLKELKVHSVLFLNIPSYGGGTRPWPTTATAFSKPRTDDGLIEVIGLTTYQLPLLQAGGHGTCIAQCRNAKIITSRTIPMQVDGEPCKLLPSIITISFKNRVCMLAKSKTSGHPQKFN